MIVTIEDIHGSKEIRELLSWALDFDINRGAEVDWFVVKPLAETRVIAGDASGGVFVLYGPQEHLIYITSEGQAGVIARDLTQGIRLMLVHPYWQDLLKFSGGGQLHEMRRVIPYLERELYYYDPDNKPRLERLRVLLPLGKCDDVISELHNAVAVIGAEIAVTSRDGYPMGSLFNTFTVESNPTWRQ